MIKESKTNKSIDKGADITKITTIDNSLADQSHMVESHRYMPLSRQDFNMGILDSWFEIRARKQPKRRSFHSAFIHKDCLYIYGGIDIVTGKLGDMKRIQLKNDHHPTWEEVKPLGVALGNYFTIIFIN